MTDYFIPIGLPPRGAGRALGEGRGGGERRRRTDRSLRLWGQAIALDRVTLRAGIAALEGCRADAVSGYREALRGWRQLGLAFDEAMAALDLAVLLAPTERECLASPIRLVQRARFWAITQIASQAPFAANRPDGRWLRPTPYLRSRIAFSISAYRRWSASSSRVSQETG